jgi:cytochrome c oxidase subunit 2
MGHGRHIGRLGVAFLSGTSLLLVGCDGSQSALDPASLEAEKIARLFWGMTIGASVTWIGMIGLGFYAVRTRGQGLTERRARWFIIGGGVVVPTVILAGLLSYGLSMLPGLVAPAPPGSLKILVSGEQWWWRVTYPGPGGELIETANEIRLPVNEPVEFHLESPDVIHAFWIPALGGKRDMIPGRVTRLVLTPTRTGVFRGVCAEYCGASHALMAFYVVVMEKADFAQWLERERGVARVPDTPSVLEGQEQFLANGCGACHRVRGTPADGVIGPDLTRVGSRLSLGAGILTNHPATSVRWISQPSKIKPGVHMPSFGMLPAEQVQAIASYLKALE